MNSNLVIFDKQSVLRLLITTWSKSTTNHRMFWYEFY